MDRWAWIDINHYLAGERQYWHTPPQGGLIGYAHLFSNHQFPFLKKPFLDLDCNNRQARNFSPAGPMGSYALP
jgi:hypothetical protein